MSGYSDDFLKDLARLLRHGHEPLSILIHDLADQAKRDELARALEGLRQIATERTGTAAVGGRKPVSRSIDLGLRRNEDPEKYDSLSGLAQLLLNAETFKDRRNLIVVSESLAVKTTQRDSRFRIVQRIVSAISVMPVADLRKTVNGIQALERGSSETFQELANFITRHT